MASCWFILLCFDLFLFFWPYYRCKFTAPVKWHVFCFPTELNAQYYLMISRQLMFELAEIYNEMMDLKMSRANSQAGTQALDKHSIKKINYLCSSAIR